MSPKKVVRKVVKKTVKKAALRPDAAQNQAGGIKTAKVDISGMTATPIRGQEKNKVKIDGGYQSMPLDMPMYIEVTRLVNEADGAVEGYVVSLDAFTYGRTVHVRIGKPKGWRRGHSPETTAKDPDKIKVWVNKTKVYEGAHGDADDRYKNGEK